MRSITTVRADAVMRIANIAAASCSASRLGAILSQWRTISVGRESINKKKKEEEGDSEKTGKKRKSNEEKQECSSVWYLTCESVHS